MGISSQDFSVFACAWFWLVWVDDEIAWPFLGSHFGHERVFQSGWKACTTSASQPRSLNLINDPVWTVGDDIFGSIPVSLNEDKSVLFWEPHWCRDQHRGRHWWIFYLSPWGCHMRICPKLAFWRPVWSSIIITKFCSNTVDRSSPARRRMLGVCFLVSEFGWN